MWRAKNERQARDKSAIYRSREWRELRAAKLRSQPICEVCEQKGRVTSAQAVHHRHPIEDSSTRQEMRKWAFMWENLMSVCHRCHADIHKAAGKGTARLSRERAEQRSNRWADSILQRFTRKEKTEEGEK